MMRPPVSLARLQLLPGSDDVLHFPKGSGDDPGSAQPERIDAMEYVARVLAQIPPPRKHLVRYHTDDLRIFNFNQSAGTGFQISTPGRPAVRELGRRFQFGLEFHY